MSRPELGGLTDPEKSKDGCQGYYCPGGPQKDPNKFYSDNCRNKTGKIIGDILSATNPNKNKNIGFKALINSRKKCQQ